MNTALRNRFINDGAATMSKERILIALYERLLLDLDNAALAIDAKDPATAHDKLVHAQQIIEELHLAVDTSAWPEGRQLVSLYLFTHERLVQANLRKDASVVRECRELLAPLADTWRDAYAQIISGAVPVGASAAAGAFERGA